MLPAEIIAIIASKMTTTTSLKIALMSGITVIEEVASDLEIEEGNWGILYLTRYKEAIAIRIMKGLPVASRYTL